MKARKSLYVTFLIAILSSAAQAQSAVESFWEVVLSDDFSKVEQHLPREFVETMKECEPNLVERMSEKPRFVIEPDIEAFRVYAPSRPGIIQFINKYDERPVEVRIVSQFVTADKATLGLVVVRKARDANGEIQKSEIVTMSFVDGSWRLMSVGVPEANRTPTYLLDGSAGTSCRLANESSAIGNLRSINTAQVTYASEFPDIGFFRRLSDAGPPADSRQPTTPAASGLLDSSLACAAEPCLKSGYSFRIKAATTLPRTSYDTFARPITYGKTGTRSFYTSEDGLIRFTTEDRDATEKDPVLD